MKQPLHRRDFLKVSTSLTASVSLAGAVWADAQQPGQPGRNERIRLGVVGVAGRGADNLAGVAHEDIVALCDVDSNRAGEARRRFPRARFYEDFRRMLDQERNLDAVVVSTPDHTHAVVGVAAMLAGKHVYCEKPLAHSVHEVQTMIQTAARQRVKTQMGTQIHAGDNYRRVVEIVQAGLLGPIRRVKVWCSRRPDAGQLAQQRRQPPAGLNYDLWLGPAPYRNYHPSHLHFVWRWWWDFGGGVLADMACHFMDLPHWALNLRYPTSVRAQGRKLYQGDNAVPSILQVDYQYPARGELPPVQLTWYHGNPRPAFEPDSNTDNYGFGNAVLFVGERGMLVADYGRYQLLPADRFQNVTLPPRSIASSIGHHREWLEAIRSNGSTTCNFDYNGALALTVLLGNAAYRSGEELRWDAEQQRVSNTRAADQYLRRDYRQGWSLT